MFEVEIDGLHGVGTLIEQALGEAVEETIAAAEHGLAVAEDVIGKSDARTQSL